MSQLLEAIASELGPRVLAHVGSKVGANPQQTQAVAAAAIPMLVAALAKNTKTPGGADALAGALERDHQPNLMDQLGPLAGMLGGGAGMAGIAGAMLGGQNNSEAGGLGALLAAAAGAMGGQKTAAMPKALRGDKILHHVLGDQQAGATSAVAKASGVDASTVAALLPILAPVVMSALGTTKKEQGLDAGGLAGFLQGEAGKLGAPPAAASSGFGADDLMKVGSALAQSGLLGKLFG
jgi:hypothetical protein